MESVSVALLADTHGFLDPRVAGVVADCDIAVHAGDVGGADVLLALTPRREVVAVRGNNDTPEKWSAGETHVLATLPREAASCSWRLCRVVVANSCSNNVNTPGNRDRRSPCSSFSKPLGVSRLRGSSHFSE